MQLISIIILVIFHSGAQANVTFLSEDAVFTIVYNSGTDKELLKSWQTKLYNEDQSELLADSGENTYNNYNYLSPSDSGSIVLTSALPHRLVPDQKYQLVVDIITQNGYVIHEIFPFTAASLAGEVFDGKITAQIIEDYGYCIINIEGNTETSGYNLVIRRSSSESNFLVWEDLAIETFASEIPKWSFIDRTVESGVWYKYGVQIQNIKGRRGSLTTANISDPVMGEWEDVFLLAENGRQLKLKYDFQISSANVNVGESKTDTIGSKYPFVRRNGAMYYRTFQCSGLITGFMDNNERLFIQPSELFYNQDIVDNYYKNTRHQIAEYVNQYDYTYEREFREKVIDFLYDNKVKLFKSLQEGNILVKLMNISLTPKNELGRLLYNFSAQAIEIGEPTLKILDNYHIQTIGTAQSQITSFETQIGQLSSFNKNKFNEDNTIAESQFNTIKAGTNIMQLIGEQCGWVYDSNGAVIRKNPINGSVIDNFQMTNLKVEFEDAPYLITKQNGKLVPFTGDSTEGVNPLLLGWLLQIDDEVILVQLPNRIYEINEPGFILDSNHVIAPMVDTQMNMIYSFGTTKEVDSTSIPNSITLYDLIGQTIKIFNPGVTNNVVTQLKNKYSYSFNENEKFNFKGLTLVDIEAEPGTIVYMRTSVMDEAVPFILNETGDLRLEFNLPNLTIEELYFNGLQVDSRFVLDFEKHNKNTKPEYPEQYDYYSENNKIFMYYGRAWRECEEVSKGIFNISCPVSALINYCVKQEKDVYSSQ